MSCALYVTMQVLEEKVSCFQMGQALLGCMVLQVLVLLKQTQLRPVVAFPSLLALGKLNATTKSQRSVLRCSSGAGVEKGFVALLVVTRITIVSRAEHLLFILNCKPLL